jgi:hypothetical protein
VQTVAVAVDLRPSTDVLFAVMIMKGWYRSAGPSSRVITPNLRLIPEPTYNVSLHFQRTQSLLYALFICIHAYFHDLQKDMANCVHWLFWLLEC